MPIDPFFTSAIKDQRHDCKQKSVAYAKRTQTAMHLAFLNKKSREKAKGRIFGQHLTRTDKAVWTLNKQSGKSGTHIVQGGPSLLGFKEPKKTWIRYKK